jgi:hypothetical protein
MRVYGTILSYSMLGRYVMAVSKFFVSKHVPRYLVGSPSCFIFTIINGRTFVIIVSVVVFPFGRCNATQNSN